MRAVDRTNAEFVVLEGLRHRNVFWTTHKQNTDPTRTADGTVAYRILGYTLTQQEAVAIWAVYVPRMLLADPAPLYGVEACPLVKSLT